LVIVMNKLLQEMASILGSFKFSLFKSKVGTCSN
jgi:hypothetical protein